MRLVSTFLKEVFQLADSVAVVAPRVGHHKTDGEKTVSVTHPNSNAQQRELTGFTPIEGLDATVNDDWFDPKNFCPM